MSRPFWEEKPLEKMTRSEWESLCDGCGKCCLHKVEDEDSGDIYMTNVACKLLDLKTGRCSDYKNRRNHVPDCVRLTAKRAGRLTWLPDTCAYRLRADGQPLPAWHYLLSGDTEAVHKAGASVVANKGGLRVIPETIAGPLHHHIIWPEGMMPMEILEEDDE